MLRQLDSLLEPEMVVAIVDGAAVTALSEEWNVKSTVTGLLTDLIPLAHGVLPFQTLSGTVNAASSHDPPASLPIVAMTDTVDQCAARTRLSSPRIPTAPSPQTGGIELGTNRLLAVG